MNDKKELVLPEITDAKLSELNERARIVYARLKTSGAVKGSDDDILDSAIVLSIFAIFNPENIPMSEEQIHTVFSAYQGWIAKTVFN